MDISIETLAAELRHMRDLQEIRDLKATYCHYCDGGWAPQGGTHCGPIADLFVEDGIWVGPEGMATAKGREEIRSMFAELQAMPFAYHAVTNPMIKIDGDEATGHWHLIGAGSLPRGNIGLFLGIYEEEYLRTAAGWRFRSMKIFEANQIPVAGGFAEKG